MTKVQGKINDGMLKDTRPEESKEKPVLSSGFNSSYRPSQSSKMEDIKEQDSEVEAASNFSLNQKSAVQTSQNAPQ
jgi:hypothetical protein